MMGFVAGIFARASRITCAAVSVTAFVVCVPSIATADGSTLVFAGYDSSGWNVWQLTHGKLARITSQADASAPSLAIDGRIAYADAVGRIWVRETDGRTSEIDDIPLPCGQPSWSPDGTQLVFACFRFSNRQDDGSLWLVKPGKNRAREIYDGPGLQKSPSWSPDGKRLVFVSGFRLTPTRVVEQIWVLDLKKNRASALVDNRAAAISPAWSPDGAQVAFASDRSGNLDLWLLDLSSQSTRQITRHPGADDKPSWSADGSHIAFQSTRSGELEIWQIPLAGGEARRLVAVGDAGLASAQSPNIAPANAPAKKE